MHKLGVQPVGYHIVRLLDRNPRTPCRFGLALHNVHTTLMTRYLDYRRDAYLGDSDVGAVHAAAR